MYDKLKKLLLIFSFLLISLIGILFINANSSEIFGGFRDVVVVEKSPIDFPKAVEDFVASNDITLARRIVDSVDDSNGQLQNTYVPIGNQPLPKGLKQQTDNELIENSSYNTVYVIVSGLMDANEVAKGLSQLKAKVRVLPTNYEIALFRLLITTPQSFLIILGLLIAYISLIFTKHIASMKEVGILRISGKGKHVIALEETKRDSMFILCLTIICVLGISGVLFLLNIFSILALSIVLVPLLSWASLIFLINFCLSHIFYYILQHQPIILSIKGKAPVGLIFLMTTIIQLFTLFSVMYCFHGMILMTKEVDLLKTGRNFWQDNVTFYEMTSLEDGGSITQTQKEIFFKELRDSSTIIYRNDMLDSIALSSNKGKKVYEPTPDLTGSVKYLV
ncbi:hypothetical protein QYR58_02835 [Streptococcus iniae]|uniref:hypothetical protein n=1 Tax=Streptococcus iniae TaxID=1346 RepID=UPI002B2DD26D|nr:hypothetical protein QYR55_03450 [Streptococcus iniae]WNZ93492.1 hypothetical protein QYR58_02835 [Streptococcus iniae]